MRPDDIERISKLVGYVIFFLVFLGWKPVGKYLLKNYPNNFFIYLFYWKYVTIKWKMVFVFMWAAIFIPLLIVDLSAPNAALISIAVSFLTVGFIVSKLQKNIWKENEKPTLEDNL